MKNLITHVLITAFTLAFSVSITPSSLAMIEPPFIAIDYCYSVSNLKQYPAFALIARPTLEVDIEEPSGGYERITEGMCLTRNTRDRIFALPKKDLKESEVGFGKQQIEYFKKKETTLLDSGVETVVSPIKSYDLQDPRRKIVEMYTIVALDKTKFLLLLTSRTITYSDGRIENLAYTQSNQPALLQNPLPSSLAEEPVETPKKNFFDFFTDIFKAIIDFFSSLGK